MEQTILANGMRTNAKNIHYKRSKLFGKKFDVALLELLYKLRGRDLKTKGISAGLGYSPKSAGAGVRINKAIVRLERDGYLRVVKNGHLRQFYVLKGIPEVDKQLPAYVVVPAAEKAVDEPTAPVVVEQAVANIDLAGLINGLNAAGVQFKITIQSEGVRNEEKSNYS